MARYPRFNARTSGRDLAAVRRPIAQESAPAAETQPEGDDLDGLKKDELVDLAEKVGVDSSGTKAEIIERLRNG